MQIKLGGWQAAVAIIVVIAVVIIRLATLNDRRNDEDLMRALELQLLTEYFPDDVESLKEAYESGDEDEIAAAAQSVTTTELTILSARTSAPLLSFSTNEKVIIKVAYSLDDAFGNREKGTKYYCYRHGAIGNIWQYRYTSNPAGYYLNFM